MIKIKIFFVLIVTIFFYGCQENTNTGNIDVDPTISESEILILEDTEQSDSRGQDIEESYISEPQLSLDQTFVSEIFGFEFKYPSSWSLVEDAYWEADEEREARPDHGARLFITDDEDEYFNISGMFSPFNPSFEGGEQSDFITDSGIEGDEYIRLMKGQVYLDIILHDGDGSQWPMGKGYHGAILRIDKDVFYQNEETIRAVLKSIDVYEVDQQLE